MKANPALIICLLPGLLLPAGCREAVPDRPETAAVTFALPASRATSADGDRDVDGWTLLLYRDGQLSDVLSAEAGAAIRATLRADGDGTFRLYLGGYKSVGQLTVRDRAGNVKTVSFGDIDTNYYREVTIEAQGSSELEVTFTLLCGVNVTCAAVVAE